MLTVGDVHDDIYINLLNRVPAPGQVSVIVAKAVNSARAEVVRKAKGRPWYYRRSNIKTTSGRLHYRLPIGLTKLMWVAYGHDWLLKADDRNLLTVLIGPRGAIDPNAARRHYCPTHFTVENQGANLFLTIEPATGENYLRIWYWADQPKMTQLSDVVDVPPEFETAVKYCALSKMWNGVEEKGADTKATTAYAIHQKEMQAANEAMEIQGRTLFKQLRNEYRWDL